jgi:hypothetical protein
MNDLIAGITSKLANISVSDLKAFLGFDACIDVIVKVVRDRDENDVTDYFSDSSQFGEFLINLKNKSCGVELMTKLSKIGGNMVITANALGNLGIKVECIGTFGIPEILPVFRTISENCKLNTIADTITATALEFDNSKVIMFDPGPYNHLTWDGIKDILGVEWIKKMISGKQLISFLNWSEIENSSQIWLGFLDEILPYINYAGEKPLFFTDFSDCSRKSKKDIQVAIDLLERFKKYFRVAISLNQNEADLVARALGLNDKYPDDEFVRSLFHLIKPDELVIHKTKDAVEYNGVSLEQCETFFCKKPAILTGGGDNFNAGYSFARLCGFDLSQSIVIANAVSGYYVKTGISPNVHNLKEFLEQYRA